MYVLGYTQTGSDGKQYFTPHKCSGCQLTTGGQHEITCPMNPYSSLESGKSVVLEGTTILGPTEDGPAITCPDCSMTSWSLKDILHGYCGNCHAFTGGV
jgi:hypothetical protein